MTLANIPSDIRNEFVVDQDGKVFAKNLKAISRLAGVSNSAIHHATDNRGILCKIANANPDSNDLSDSLKPFAGKDYTQIRKYPDMLVAAIVGYYAYDAKETNDTAKANFRAMAMVGFRTWFQQELGWKKPEVPEARVSLPLSTLQGLIQVTNREIAIQKVLVNQPGLQATLDAFATTDYIALPASKVTLKDYLATKGIELSKEEYFRVCGNVAEAIKNHYGHKPDRLAYKGTNGNISRAYVYSTQDYPVIDSTLVLLGILAA